jgi:hydrogenase maturation protein HypF
LSVERRRVRVTGTVQGVGFRPFVYREAVALELAGYVRNDAAGVLIEVQGPPDEVAELCRRLVDSPPPLARVDCIETTLVPPSEDVGFAILTSNVDGTPDAPVSVDTATCAECLAEVDDAADRRFGYPFTNCTNCGPRYTIVRSVPYDRPATTMASFAMCGACQREYDDPNDRRFHAQPNACPECGPRLSWNDGELVGADALTAAVDALGRGGVVAVKGLGGYHLATDATDDTAVSGLRRRKHRDDKPFALMVPDVATARSMVELDAAGEATLTSPRRPIVVAPRRQGAPVGPAVAPGLSELGVMLPYTPLHHLLLLRLARPLVLTSGNLSDEPIAHTDDDARARLGPLVDGVLAHDRPIHIRCDDSVVRATGGAVQVLRRSRGYAPEPMRLPFPAHRAVLAVGGELKSTVSVAKATAVVASHHIGDLEHLAAYDAFVQATEHLCRLYGVRPEVVAHDLHPDYLSTKFALELDLPALAVQHHHAHVASCLVDHGRTDAVLGVAFDGHGFGPDGTLWGGELLVADLDGYTRVGHLATVALPGGSAAIREPWRMAVTWTAAAGDVDAACRVGARFDDRVDALVRVIEAPATLRTSSVGRLFDAAAAIVCGRGRAGYEGQAAMELEALAATVPLDAADVWPVEQRTEHGQLVLDPSGVIVRLASVGPGPAAAAAFHASMGRATVDAATSLARRHGLDTVALTGGVFQNARLARIVAHGLRDAGLEVLLHRDVPPNDGGISIGQAAIAAHQS